MRLLAKGKEIFVGAVVEELFRVLSLHSLVGSGLLLLFWLNLISSKNLSSLLGIVATLVRRWGLRYLVAAIVAYPLFVLYALGIELLLAKSSYFAVQK